VRGVAGGLVHGVVCQQHLKQVGDAKDQQHGDAKLHGEFNQCLAGSSGPAGRSWMSVVGHAVSLCALLKALAPTLKALI
jgi:hypothetical protein